MSTVFLSGVTKVDRSGCTTLNILEAIELCTSNGFILRYVNYASAKLFLKRINLILTSF